MRPAFVLLLLFCSACSDAFLQPKESEPTNIDNRLTLKGQICTAVPDPTGFPVKVVLVVDQSGSMCISDPPGSQMMGTFCADALAKEPPPIPTEPARVRAMKKLFGEFAGQPNVQVAILPFETNVKGTWPQGGGFATLADPANLASATARVNALQSELGKGTDYQGALSAAYSLVSSDIFKTEMTQPELLPRTRYVVVFLTDGTPYPRCAANDMLAQYADADHPDLLWADSSSAVTFCNAIDAQPCMDPTSSDCVFGYVAGTDRNQNYQLYAYVDQLMELKSSHNIGDVRLHTVLLFNEEAVRNCGPMCQDLYGTYPNTPAAQYPQAAHKIAQYILTKLAERGNGIYQEFDDNAGVANFSLGALDYSSLASRNVMKTLLVRSMSAAPGDVDRVDDADGDGLPDSMDNNFYALSIGRSWRSEQFFADTDGDCFDDNFEVMHYDDGFRPDVKDGRGCDPMSPLTLNCACRDTDGDGLSQYAEDYLHTRQTVVDSDGDGVPDGMEARYGLDPLVPQANGLDTDGDGNSDLAEFRADSNPIHRDTAFFDKNGYEYEITPTEMPDNTICYQFSVSNLQLVKTDGQPGATRIGFNLFKVYFAESPESGVATDYGVWRTACAWAQYAPPSVRVPAGPELDFGPDTKSATSWFKAPSTMTGVADYLAAGRCLGTHP
jgi:hypothetical protein